MTGELHPALRLQPEGDSMADIAPGGRPPAPSARMSGRRRAAGIYGAIVTAAILDAAGGKLPTDALVVAVVATLVVYGSRKSTPNCWASKSKAGPSRHGTLSAAGLMPPGPWSVRRICRCWGSCWPG
jgi:hypothetical protein